MGTPRLLSLMCLGIAVSLAASQSLVTPDTGTSETMVSIHFFIQNVNYGQASEDDVTHIVNMVMSEVGGELVTLEMYNGSPCIKVYLQWKNADLEVVNALFRRVAMMGYEVDGIKYHIGFEGCRPPAHHLEVEFYLQGMAWKESLLNVYSQDYMQLKNMVGEYFSALDGELKAMYLRENYDCVHVMLQYEARQPTKLFGVMSILQTDGFMLYDDAAGTQMTYKVSSKPCMPSTEDKNECPPPARQYLTTCNDTCDAATPCQAGYRCCYSGCGMACVRVGYALSLRGTLVLEMPWLLNLLNPTSTDYVDMGTSLTVVMREQFGAMLHDVDIHQYGPFHNDDMMNATTVSVTLYLNQDYSNDQLYKAYLKVMKSVVPMGQMAYKVAVFKLAMEGRCGDKECHGICKHHLSGQADCSCDLGRFGPGCQHFDCRKDVSSAFPDLSENFCRAGGQCRRNDEYEEEEEEEDHGEGMGRLEKIEDYLYSVPKYVCDCEEPYFGETCQYQLCDLLINPCNGHGQCTGYTRRGEICQCDPGWSGLFCDVNQDVIMTPCEKERQLMTFVHDQVTGEMDKMEAMVFPMKKMPFHEERFYTFSSVHKKVVQG